MRGRTTIAAVIVGLTMALAAALPASAAELLTLTGNYGDFGTAIQTADDAGHPGAKCGYSVVNQAGLSYLQWIKVFPFKATAYDRTGAVDHQPVTFKVTLQVTTNPVTTWTNVRNVSETRTAYDNKSAGFDTLKVSVNGKAGKLYRAIVTLKWLYSGQTDGLARLRMEYYQYKWAINPSFIGKDLCPGEIE